LDVPALGKFKCPRCGAILAAEATGRVRFFSSKKGKPVLVSVPSAPAYASSVAEMAGRCAESLGFNGDSVEVIALAVDAACKNVIEKAYENDANNVMHVMFVPNGSSLTIKITDYGHPFEFSGGSIYSDVSFSPVVNNMDTVEHRTIPSGGNLLTLIKILQ
jgi:hypothetical protein